VFCPHCGKEISETAKICGYCGQRLEAVEGEQPALSAKQTEKPLAKIATDKPIKPAAKAVFQNIPRWAWIAIGGIVLLLAVFLVSQAALEDVVFVSMMDEVVHVPAGSEVVLTFSWTAKTAELVEDFLAAQRLSLTADGIRQANPDAYWSPVERSKEDWDGDGSRDYDTHWEYPLGKLEAGRHEVILNGSYAFPITDGFDLDGDGGFDTYSGTVRFELAIIVD